MGKIIKFKIILKFYFKYSLNLFINAHGVVKHLVVYGKI